MRTFVIGCNHRTAPVTVREKLAFDDAHCAEALRHLGEAFPEAEGVILSTCNRTELYLARPVCARPLLPEAIAFLAEQRHIPLHEFTASLYQHEDAEAVRHLFHVVSSLDSMVVGESGILAQAKHALQIARQAMPGGEGGTHRLDALFQRAFAVAKEVHTRTQIGSGHVSVGSIAVDFARQIFSQFGDKTVLMIGAGEMGELTLTHLMEVGPRRVLVTNRTAARAEELARRIGAEARPFDGLIGLVAEADIVLSCTGSPDPVITRERFARVPQMRRYRPLLMIDMAVPRDIDPEVGELQAVFLYDIDALQQVTEQHVADRKGKIEQSERIIEQAVLEYLHWQGSRDVGPTIAALNEHFDEVAAAEFDWLDPKLKQAGEKDRELIRQMLHRVVKKMLHAPTRVLHHKAQHGRGQIYAETMRTLFDLREQELPTPEQQAADHGPPRDGGSGEVPSAGEQPARRAPSCSAFRSS